VSNRATLWAWASIKAMPDLKPRAVLTLLALADCHNQETGRCDPSVRYLAERTHQCERAVRMALRELEVAKLLKTTFRQQSTGRGRVNKTSRYAFRGGAYFAGRVGHGLPTNQEQYQPEAMDGDQAPSKWFDIITTDDDGDVVIPLRRAGHA
jgi:hypothetical protein